MPKNQKQKRAYGTNLSGLRIRKARIKMGIGQAELVAALEVDHGIKIHRSDLGLIEQQKRGVSDLELVAFSKTLKVSVSWLLFGDGQQK